MKVEITDFIEVEIDKEKDQFAIDVAFKCCDCNHKYFFRKNTEYELEQFMESLKNKIPIEDIRCPKCVGRK